MKIFFLIINLVAFATYGLDKLSAIRGGWRVRETVLIGMAMAGGSVGGILAMQLFHHKTRKPLFAIGLPLILVIQVAAVYYWGHA